MNASVSRMWPDGEGGWIVIGYQRFDDQQSHLTTWRRSADGTLRRLGCSPETGFERVEVRPAEGPDAIYIASVGDSEWRLVRIPDGAAQ